MGNVSSTTIAAQWADELRSWKIGALNHVVSQLDHICAGSKSRLKSFAVADAVRHTVARDFDPESPTGLHLQHMLTGAIAQQLLLRDDLLPKFQSEFARSFPGSPADAPLGIHALLRQFALVGGNSGRYQWRLPGPA